MHVLVQAYTYLKGDPDLMANYENNIRRIWFNLKYLVMEKIGVMLIVLDKLDMRLNNAKRFT